MLIYAAWSTIRGPTTMYEFGSIAPVFVLIKIFIFLTTFWQTFPTVQDVTNDWDVTAPVVEVFESNIFMEGLDKALINLATERI